MIGFDSWDTGFQISRVNEHGKLEEYIKIEGSEEVALLLTELTDWLVWVLKQYQSAIENQAEG